MKTANQQITQAANARLSYAMVSPQRCRLVANLIRGKSVEDASRVLILENKKSAKILYKLLKSAMSNAEQKGVADLERLYIADLRVDEAPRIKRWMPRAQGRADRRITRTSHISLGLAEKAGGAAKTKSTGKAKKTTKASSKKEKGSEE